MKRPWLAYIAYVFYGIPVVAALGFVLWLMWGMYISLWFGQETYDCVRAIC